MTTEQSIKYRSAFEARVHKTALNENLELLYEPPASKMRYLWEAVYQPDFVLPNGIIVETKGRLTAPDRRKMLAVKKAHPEMDIRFVFQKASNPIRKGSKTKYWQWADDHGFEWAEGTIPLEWWDE